MYTYKIDIAFDMTPEIHDSLALDDLHNSLLNSSIVSLTKKSTPQIGRKDGGLTIALAIAGLAVNVIGTLLSAISLWQSGKKYTITLKRGNQTFTIDNLNTKQFQSIVEQLSEDD